MSTITKRLDALEAQSTPARRFVVLWSEPNETDAQAWARLYPGEPLDPEANIMRICWVSPDDHDGGEAR
jgi:hypothetical protein